MTTIRSTLLLWVAVVLVVCHSASPMVEAFTSTSSSTTPTTRYGPGPLWTFQRQQRHGLRQIPRLSFLSSSSDPWVDSNNDNIPSETEQEQDRPPSTAHSRATFATTLEFPSYSQLMQVPAGQSVSSAPFTMSVPSSSTPPQPQEETKRTKSYRFCVKLYPRGKQPQQATGWNFGSSSSSSSMAPEERPGGGFGMSYASMFDPSNNNNNKKETVGLYVQRLPCSNDDDNNNDFVDVSFALRLVGQQQWGRKFDVEWRSGMRIGVSTSSSSSFLVKDERLGLATEWGAPLMETPLLSRVLGVDDDDDESDKDDPDALSAWDKANQPVQVQVQVQLHHPYTAVSSSSSSQQQQQSRSQPPDGTTGIRRWALQAWPDMRDQVTSSSSSSSSSSNNQADASPGQSPQEEPLLRVGRIVVPVLQTLSQRPAMFQAGVYPGVEYRVLRMVRPLPPPPDTSSHSTPPQTTTTTRTTTGTSTNDDNDDEIDVFFHEPGVDYELKPLYPLVPQLERAWPVRIAEQDIPHLVTPTQYNILSAVGSLVTAMTGLVSALVISQLVSFFVIPSQSMEPTLLRGDVVLVEKVTPRLAALATQLVPGQTSVSTPTVGNVVLFRPPLQLQNWIQQQQQQAAARTPNGGSSSSGRTIGDRDLFVKRVAAVPGDVVTVVDSKGTVRINGMEPVEDRSLCSQEPLGLLERYIEPLEFVVPPNAVAVLGDCRSVSIDSRVWQSLPVSNIVGRPVIRLWPPARVGPVEALPTVVQDAIRTGKDDWNQ